MKEDLMTIFREGAIENFTELEEALLKLSENPGDSKEIDRAFRVMHTIKGCSSMLGFENIASFSHALETEFDVIRTGRAKFNPEIIQLALLAKDHLEILIDHEFSPAETPLPSDKNILDPIKALIQAQNSSKPQANGLEKAVEAAAQLCNKQKNRSHGADFLENLLNHLTTILNLARQMHLESLIEFSQPLLELTVEYLERNVSLPGPVVEIIMQGLEEMHTFFPPGQTAPQEVLDVEQIMAALERPIVLAAKVSRFLDSIRHVAPPFHQYLKPFERVVRLSIKSPPEQEFPEPLKIALEKLGLWVELVATREKPSPGHLWELTAAG